MRALVSTFLFVSIQVVSAHYTFAILSVNDGPISKAWQYVRNVTKSFAYFETSGFVANYVPYYDIYDENVRCGRGAAVHGPGVETLVVNAGDRLTFWPTRPDTTTSEEVIVYGTLHEGPGQAYLSKVPGDLESYTGDGDWFKIGSVTADNSQYWEVPTQGFMNFTIPETTPPGKYLMRVEHIAVIGSYWNSTQFYINCAHIEVKGPGGGKPGPMVKFPGAYDSWDTAIWFPYHVSSMIESERNLIDYIGPGPPVWTG